MPTVRPARACALMSLLPVLLGACLGALGCGGPQRKLSYADSAELAYRTALGDFYDDDCLMAEPALADIRRKFPYSRFAALSELRIADCQFKDGKYPEAIQGYRDFARYHPSHPEVPYARFQAALSHFRQIPDDWWLTPHAYERDQHYTEESLHLFRRFLLDHPADPLSERARGYAERAMELLAAHELSVAEFYLNREHPLAAIGRLRTLIQSYPGSRREPHAMRLLGETYLAVDDRERAERIFAQLQAQHPQSAEAAAVRGRR